MSESDEIPGISTPDLFPGGAAVASGPTLFVQSEIFCWLLINEKSQVCTYTAEAVIL